jgi:cbb3-type cytochrome oxidase cytochrome c subunit
MNHGPLIFLGVLATFVASWWGLIFAPQVQIGSQQNAQADGTAYPNRRSGLAEQGHHVYVANGCVHCHSQQVRQEGYTFAVVVSGAGTNKDGVIRVLGRVASGVNADAILAAASDASPQIILTNVSLSVAEEAQKRLQKVGAAARMVFVPIGTDLERQWGSRRTVAADYMVDSPVQVGHSRLGPDLSNYGERAPNAALILMHLYDPRTTMPKSLMPAHRYLFEKKALGKSPSPHALPLTGNFAPESGYEIVATDDALRLVAYLQSLRANTMLFEAPMTAAPITDAGTNAPAATNAPATPPKA